MKRMFKLIFISIIIFVAFIVIIAYWLLRDLGGVLDLHSKEREELNGGIY